jgi:hypothetical protein
VIPAWNPILLVDCSSAASSPFTSPAVARREATGCDIHINHQHHTLDPARSLWHSLEIRELTGHEGEEDKEGMAEAEEGAGARIEGRRRSGSVHRCPQGEVEEENGGEVGCGEGRCAG